MSQIDTAKLSTITLGKGAHHRPEDGLCLMEAVAYVRVDDVRDRNVIVGHRFHDQVGFLRFDTRVVFALTN